MSGRSLALHAAVRPQSGLQLRWAGVPWWGRALLVFGASRVVTTAFLLFVASFAQPGSRAGVRPSLGALAMSWDGVWYWSVAFFGYGYPGLTDAGGAVQQNNWAFLPLYPTLVKALALGDVQAWPRIAPLVSVAFGFGCAVLLGLLLRSHLGPRRAGFAVAIFACSPLSFILQIAYAESMGLFLLLAALCLIDRNRYWTAIPVAVALAFTRPGVLALALAVAAHLALRLWRSRRADPVPPLQWSGAIVLVVVAFAAGLAWTVIVGVATGEPDAYLRTEAAWRSLWMGDAPYALVTPWFFAAGFWFGPVVGPIVLVAVLAGFVVLLFVPPVRRLGSLNRLWIASYGVYLVAVFFPQSSIFRLLMPMAPLTGAVAPRSTIGRGLVLVGCLAAQGLWMWCVLGLPQVYWAVP